MYLSGAYPHGWTDIDFPSRHLIYEGDESSDEDGLLTNITVRSPGTISPVPGRFSEPVGVSFQAPALPGPQSFTQEIFTNLRC